MTSPWRMGLAPTHTPNHTCTKADDQTPMRELGHACARMIAASGSVGGGVVTAARPFRQPRYNGQRCRGLRYAGRSKEEIMKTLSLALLLISCDPMRTPKLILRLCMTHNGDWAPIG
jgi:hypothetical protein